MTTTPATANVSSVLFQDAMDTTRFIRIVAEKTKSAVCKVWFGPDKNHLIYHGQTELPKSLFEFNGGTRIGFNPAREPEDPKVAKLREAAMKERAARRASDRDDY